jgi:hypothetical protein
LEDIEGLLWGLIGGRRRRSGGITAFVVNCKHRAEAGAAAQVVAQPNSPLDIQTHLSGKAEKVKSITYHL